MTKKKNTLLAIIIRSTDKEATELCIAAIKEQKLPSEFTAEIIIMEGQSRAAAYNQAMQQSDAPYKIYIDEHSVIVEDTLFARLIELLKSDPSLGCLGVAGTKVILSDGNPLLSPKRSGMVFDIAANKKVVWSEFSSPFEEVMTVDGFIVATSHDIDWREDLFKGDIFSVYAQCIEFRRRGYKCGVINQDVPAIACTKKNDEIGEIEQKAFLTEYYRDILPLVSVIIPTYNRPKWFIEALESVLAQTYKNLDIFVTDNSHNPQTYQKIQSYLKKDSRIKYEHHPDFDAIGNWGRARSYNNPEAEYVNWLMDDDLWHPKKIATMIDYLLIDEGLGLVTSVRRLIDAEGKEIQREGNSFIKMAEKNTRFSGRSVGREILTSMTNFVGEPTTVLVRKKYMLDGYRLGFSGREGIYSVSDFPTWLKVLSQSDMVYIAEPLSDFRVHDGQQQLNSKTMVRGFIG